MGKVTGMDFGRLDSAVLLLVAALSGLSVRSAIPFRGHFQLRYRQKKYPASFNYEDEDGVASDETQKAFSVKSNNILLVLVTTAGILIALAGAVCSSIFSWGTITEDWITFAIWSLLVVQGVLVLLERKPLLRYRLSLYLSASYACGSFPYWVHFYLFTHGSLSPFKSVRDGLQLAKFGLTICGLLTSLSYPRRPVVYHEGRIIDNLGAISALSRYTYGWASGLLSLSYSGKKLDLEDLPSLDHTSRAADLCGPTVQENAKGSLLKFIIRYHSSAIITQYWYTLLEALSTIAPQLAMYQLLKLLEARDAGESVTTMALVWILGLGGSMILSGFFMHRMWWASDCRLYLAVRTQLSAIIFAKAMKRKEFKGATVDEKTLESSSDEAIGNGTPDMEHITSKEDEDREAAEMRKTRQGVVNLIGVDTKRVADFALFQNHFFGAAIRLAVCLSFLGTLVGWQSLVTGLGFQLLLLPLNIYASKKYGNNQDLLMKARDRKLAVVNEALSGIRQIKFAALEKQWQEKILAARTHELKTLWDTLLSDIVLISLWTVGPILLSATTIGVYAFINGRLEPSVAFTTISMLSRIEATLSYLPELTTDLLDALVSIKRIETYLTSPEKGIVTTPGDNVSFKDATVTWPSDQEDPDTFTLYNVNLEFPTGELSVISGKTGAGKSLLLSAILGEVEILSGSITVPKSPSPSERNDKAANRGNWILPNALAFVPQHPWIENCTFRDNILFGLPWDEERYQNVIEICALEKDLDILIDGDMTEIGPNGINLSGGQCWRLTLARALYSRAGILVLDDIFSAVDAHVGKHIFEKALTGPICEGRTRILVTHHVALCIPKTLYEVHLGDGHVEYAGAVREMQQSGAMEAILDVEEPQATDLDDDVGEQLESVKRRLSSVSRRLSQSQTVNGNPLSRSESIQKLPAGKSSAQPPPPPQAKQDLKKFVEDERTEEGRVAWTVYRKYLQAAGGIWFWILVIILFTTYEALLLGRSWVLRLWTRHEEIHALLFSRISASFYLQNYMRRINDVQIEIDDSLKYYFSVYVGVSLSICIIGTVRIFWVFTGSIKASRIMFDRITYAVLRAPLRWLDTMPVGRILNRFTADFNVFDATQAYGIAFLIYNILAVIGIVIAAAAVSSFMILGALVLLTICSRYALYFLSAAREVKRLESIAKSPIFEHFSTALMGVSTLRAYEKSDVYIRRMFDKVDAHARCIFYLSLFKRWLGWRLNIAGAIFTCIVAGLLVGIESMDAALAGFALGFAMQYNDAIFWCLRHFTEVELGMNSTERIIEYSEIEIEKQGGEDVPASWPNEGRMEVKDLVVAYAPDLDPVLKGISFSLQPKERVGVVGRTGAGKSSLTLALFRFLEARQGHILVDGIDISRIKLSDLRSRLAIIPQDPVLFSGSVRSNLDPFDERGDQELRDALERVHLVSSSSEQLATPTNGSGSGSINSGATEHHNTNVFKSLTSSVTEGGQNLSQGQRQLLCLARAIVARPKIMVLDEATSAVDKGTDAMIQRSIREEFEDSTLVVIAHRLSTIADFDRILVLDEGRVVELDSPRNLIEIEDGVFRGMVESSGERDSLKQSILGEPEAQE